MSKIIYDKEIHLISIEGGTDLEFNDGVKFGHRILDILNELHEAVDYENEYKMVDDKILDSFDLVTLVTELGEEFDVEITAKDFVEENFNSVDALTSMIARLLEEE